MTVKSWTVALHELAQNGPLVGVVLGGSGSQKVLRGKALIDTGASRSAVSARAAGLLALTEKGKRHARGLNDTAFQERAYYEVKVRIPEMDLDCELEVVD